MSFITVCCAVLGTERLESWQGASIISEPYNGNGKLEVSKRQPVTEYINATQGIMLYDLLSPASNLVRRVLRNSTAALQCAWRQIPQPLCAELRLLIP